MRTISSFSKSLTFCLCCLFPALLFSQNKKNYFDGPYIFHQNDSLRLQWVEYGKGYDTLIAKSDAGIFQRDSLPIVDLQNLDFKVDREMHYENVEKVVALSDVHGQYDIMMRLLRANKVVDENNHWAFGKGHLVIVGDNLDRGEQVLDILWFLFFLQKEADLAGGKVQVLLGNHEIMVLKGDIRYIARKYYYTSALFTRQYHDFFQKGSVLGDWMRNHKVITTIDRRLFVHGGISSTVLKLNYSLEKINDIFSYQLLETHDTLIVKDEELALLYYDIGPIWYRGYFDPNVVSEDTIDYILKKMDLQTLVVGHTSFLSIQSLFNDKLVSVDCSIKLGITGQVLIIKDNRFFIGDIEGKSTLLSTKVWTREKLTLFSHLYHFVGKPQIKLTTDVKRMIRKSEKEEYQPAKFEVTNPKSGEKITLSAKLRARGHMRKQVCYLPPIKVDFSKKALDKASFVKAVDKLKIVFPCNSKGNNQQLLYKEYFLYDLYTHINKHSIRAKLVDIICATGDEEKYNVTGILIEDEEAYAHRKDARIIDKGKVSASRLDRDSWLKMRFFQYLIANTDWSLRNRHNLELVKLPNVERVMALPYDFDYSGFVGQTYSVPHPSLPIDDVQQRYFMKYPITTEEVNRMIEYYQSIEQDLYKVCEEATYMNDRTRNECKKYIESFYKLLKKPKRIISEAVK